MLETTHELPELEIIFEIIKHLGVADVHHSEDQEVRHEAKVKSFEEYHQQEVAQTHPVHGEVHHELEIHHLYLYFVEVGLNHRTRIFLQAHYFILEVGLHVWVKDIFFEEVDDTIDEGRLVANVLSARFVEARVDKECLWFKNLSAELVHMNTAVQEIRDRRVRQKNEMHPTDRFQVKVQGEQN